MSTRRAYQAGVKKFVLFCNLYHFHTPLPVSQSILCLYVTFLAKSSLSSSTIQSYLSALRYLHISLGLPEPDVGSMAKLKLVVRGIRRLKGKDFNGKRRLPITPSILRDLRRWWERSPSFESALLWAVCCTAFFGFFRLGELLPTTVRGDPALSIGDIAVDKHDSPSLVRIHLRSSKMDSLCHGVDVFLGITCNELCPVSAMVSYLAQRGSKEGPVFVLEDGSPLLKSAFVQKFKRSALNSNWFE